MCRAGATSSPRRRWPRIDSSASWYPLVATARWRQARFDRTEQSVYFGGIELRNRAAFVVDAVADYPLPVPPGRAARVDHLTYIRRQLGVERPLTPRIG